MQKLTKEITMKFQGKKYTLEKYSDDGDWWSVCNKDGEVLYSFMEDELEETVWDIETLLGFEGEFVKMSCAKELYELVMQLKLSKE